MDPEEHKRVSALRRAIGELSAPDAMEKILQRMEKTKNNAEFLLSLRPTA